jgi:alpha-L-arabinofuranosidase
MRVWFLTLIAGVSLAAESSFLITNRDIGRVDDRLFGQFMELVGKGDGNGEQGGDLAIDPVTGDIRTDVEAALATLAYTVVRYPGGGKIESPGFRWTQLIDGPDDGDAKNERRYPMGLHTFLDWCERSGTAPLLVLKLADLVRAIIPPEEVRRFNRAFVAYVALPDDEGVPEDLRQWTRLRVANGRTQPWSVRLWQIGNEFTWVAVGSLRKQGLDDATIAERYVDACGQVIADLRALVPDCEVIVENNMDDPEIGLDVSERIAEKLGDRVQYLSTHRYWSWAITRLQRDGVDIWPGTTCSLTDFWQAIVSAGNKDERGQSRYDSPMLRKAMAHGYSLALTEWNWNSWWALGERGERPQPFAQPLWAKGLAATSMLHGFMNAAGPIALANQSMLIGNDWDIRAIDVGSDGIRIHPGGRMLALYRAFHGTQVLAWEGSLPTRPQPLTVGQLESCPTVAAVDLVVTRDERNLYLHCLSREVDSEQTLVVDAGALAQADGSAAVHRLLGPPLDASDAEACAVEIETVMVPASGPGHWRITVPARSVEVVVVPLR